MFQSARLKLTVWYLLIIMLISIMFSLTIYRIQNNELEREYHRFNNMYRQNVFNLMPSPNMPPLDATVVAESEERLKLTLIYVNLIILGVAGVGGYLLAGITLKPIRKMIDEQNRFVADASHELRTPLTSLRAEIEVYLRGKKHTTEESDMLLQSNLEEVNKLQYLSDNLIQLAQYPKVAAIPFAKVILAEATQNAVGKLEKAAKQKHITIQTNKNSFSVLGDKEQLMQLVSILLDNAIKYSPEKSTIIISTKKTDHNVLLSIKDTGMGIEKEALPHIFDRFYRADSSRSKQSISGYGLGLSIAKHIVLEHKGTIHVKSEVGKGSTFTIKLPLLG